MLKELPEGLTLRGKTAVFTTDSLPTALQKWHDTKAGVWGKIVVTKGAVLYEILTEPRESMHLFPGVDGIIAPQEPHKVTPEGDIEMQVFFYHKK